MPPVEGNTFNWYAFKAVLDNRCRHKVWNRRKHARVTSPDGFICCECGRFGDKKTMNYFVSLNKKRGHG